MTPITPAAGTLTGPRQHPGSSITVHGLYTNWPIEAAAADSEWIAAGDTGPVHDGDLIFAVTQATGPMRIHYSTAREWRPLALAAVRIADWLEATA